ncbi:MAG: hypothetical protein L0Y66_01745 [Myxococcaceae bacterium]|nr:hypothetical protein [Myxococcaceae bacterium]MCI0670144.1 hypothetical protein [Myxococcaceae bacterium]
MSHNVTVTGSAVGTAQDHSQPTSIRSLLAPWTLWGSALLLAFEVGGGFYEHLVLDWAWPSNLALIQPQNGGVNRAPFWIVVHTLLSFSLLGALWSNWRNTLLRKRLVWTLGIHVALRAWTFAYFIPAALRFEAAQILVPEQAQTWVMLTPIRTLVTFAALVILWRPRDGVGAGGLPYSGTSRGSAG